MKIRRLSEIDLARLCALHGDALDRAADAYEAGGSAWSYDPTRQSTADILDASVPLFDGRVPVPWVSIANQITRACKRGKEQIEANLEVGKTLFDFSRAAGWDAVKFEMGRLPIGLGESVRYWSDVVVADADGPFIPFFDHRRAGGIVNAAHRQVVFSMQHLWVRERHPDLADARLAIIRFPATRDGRAVTIEFHRETELLSFSDLDGRVRQVYEAWARATARKRHDSRMTGTDGGNPFGF